MNGVLVIDKPSGMTSFDVVAAVRRLVREKKAGHTGTLDPFATGVLPVCLGPATRIAAYVTEGDKEYEATVRLGAATDSQDRTGTVIATAPVGEVTRERIEPVLARFRGALEQVPPMHSAIKVDGRPLYELAHKGKVIEREPRKVTVHELELLEAAAEGFRLRVRCSKGTYVRTLAHDIGEALGCHAHLAELRRTESAGLRLDRAVTLDQLARLAPDEVARRLLSPRDALVCLPELVVDAAGEEHIKHGRKLGAAELPGLGAVAEGGRLRLSSLDGRLLAVAERRGAVAVYLRVLA